MKRSSLQAPPVICWFRHDLRVADNPALSAAAQRGPVIPVFIWAPEEETPWEPGAASRWWLHQSLAALSADLHARGSRLVLRQGSTLAELSQLISETGARAVFWNRRYEPAVLKRDEGVRQGLQTRGVETQTFNAALLHEPWEVKNKSGKPFQVFTAFWRHCLTLQEPPPPLAPPVELTSPPSHLVSTPLNDLKLEPVPDWAGGLRAAWQPGEQGAARLLRQFVMRGLSDYTNNRNRPDLEGTSRLSPYLHFGELSPRQIWRSIRQLNERKRGKSLENQARDWRHSQFIAELGWREFAHHLLYHFPHTPSEPLRPEFRKFRWRNRPDWLKAWQRGKTGYPLVDAGMRQLWQTGWMHNRVRMAVASFLVKDLLISWQEGARWFWDTLVDADLAQNTLGWQWTAGCGADAAPFFRIFNPTIQGKKFDPDGAYIRRWVPELAEVPEECTHEPHEAPRELPGLTQGHKPEQARYPDPIVSHAVAREIALEAYNRLRS